MTGSATQVPLIHDVSQVAGYAHDCFADPAAGPAPARPAAGRVGAELELLVFDRADPARHVPKARVEAALPALPGGSRVTFEPGGQLELSGPPGGLADAVDRLTADVTAVTGALAGAGLVAAGVGLDPVRPPLREPRGPRYDAMAEFFGPPYGPLMMCSTTSVQINLDLGDRPRERWERAHLLGPVLVAAFANSPLSGGAPVGWMSGRQRVWHHLDHSRTAPVPVTPDPADGWAAYLLDARLMLVRDEAGGCRPVRDGSTFRDRIAAPGPPPSLDDLAYHATTLFPPVRPRGWLEIRYIDAQRLTDWPVCVAVTHALVADDRAADAALAAAEPCRDQWRRAALCGLADPMLRRAADACFRAALTALPRLGAPPELTARVAAFADRHVTPGRSPAADLLDRARRHPTAWLVEGDL